MSYGFTKPAFESLSLVLTCESQALTQERVASDIPDASLVLIGDARGVIDFPEVYSCTARRAIARIADDFYAAVRRLLAASSDAPSHESAVLGKSWAHCASLLIDLYERRVQPAEMESR